MVALAATAVIVAGSRPSDDRPEPDRSTTEPAPVEVASDAPSHRSLAELVAASDLVVRGTVQGVERGRWFGDGASGPRIRSRLVSITVEETLIGDPPEGGAVLVEEEGWTEDGHPLIVDGAAPSAAGDEGIWFLVDPGDATTGALIVVNAQGRYLIGPDGTVRGAVGDDPLVADLSSRSLDDLAERITGRAGTPNGSRGSRTPRSSR